LFRRDSLPSVSALVTESSSTCLAFISHQIKDYGVSLLLLQGKMPSGGVFYINPLFLLKDIGPGLIAVTKAAIAPCLDAFAPLRFGSGNWGYCRGGSGPCQQPPLYNFSIRSF
jgi:hypothetical protein